jgi:hypothetical protein
MTLWSLLSLGICKISWNHWLEQCLQQKDGGNSYYVWWHQHMLLITCHTVGFTITPLFGNIFCQRCTEVKSKPQGDVTAFIDNADPWILSGNVLVLWQSEGRCQYSCVYSSWLFFTVGLGSFKLALQSFKPNFSSTGDPSYTCHSRGAFWRSHGESVLFYVRKTFKHVQLLQS